MPTDDHVDTGSPVFTIESDLTAAREPEVGVGLCLSGGGYRAMLFHAGTLWRLCDGELLPTLTRISSVSGGSITAGVLALAWGRAPIRDANDYAERVVKPIRRLASRTIDRGAILGGALLPGTIGDKVANAYRKHLFHDNTLQDLPDEPRFVFNATNVQSGALWRFMKPYMRDWKVGEVKNPRTELAVVVAASSAFPPFLSPVTLEVDPEDFTPGSGELDGRDYRSDVVLTDGGVYDNLGLETVWKRYRTVLVSDAGGRLAPEPDPDTDWARHSYRVLNLIDNQVRSLRKRLLIDSYVRGQREGAYWGIRTDVRDYGLANPLLPWDDAQQANAQELADTPTRLKALSDRRQERLINWGYVVCDTALRRHLNPRLPGADALPYPAAGV